MDLGRQVTYNPVFRELDGNTGQLSDNPTITKRTRNASVRLTAGANVRAAAKSTTSEMAVMHELQKFARARVAPRPTRAQNQRTVRTSCSLSVVDPIQNSRRWVCTQAIETPADLTCLKLGSMVGAMFVHGFEIWGLHDYNILHHCDGPS
jgi:hypothetical protein